MADPEDQPKRGAAGIPPTPRKAAAKKTPAKKAPAKKATPQRTLETPPAQTASDTAARALRPTPEGDYRLPISLGLAAAGLVALVLSRLRRG